MLQVVMAGPVISRKITVTDEVQTIVRSSTAVRQIILYVVGADGVNWTGVDVDGDVNVEAFIPMVVGTQISAVIGSNGVTEGQFHLFCDEGKTCEVVVMEIKG